MIYFNHHIYTDRASISDHIQCLELKFVSYQIIFTMPYIIHSKQCIEQFVSNILKAVELYINTHGLTGTHYIIQKCQG